MNRNLSQLLSAVAIVCLALFLTYCHKNSDDPTPQPTITGFTPTTGLIGDAITITGTNFNTTGTTVAFAGTSATVTSVTDTQIVTAVPSGATSGKITVTVNGKMATSSVDFIVKLPPTIASFSPSAGTVSTSVTITGSNFSTTPASNDVKINGVSATVTGATATQLIVAVGDGTRTGKITVAVNGLTATSTDDFTVNPPTITSFSPTTSTQGSTVVITGTNFSPVAANNILKFATFDGVATSSTSTSITTSVPANFLGGKISVTVNGFTVTSAADMDIPQPTITSMSPLHGLPGSEVTITGTAFGSLTSSAKLIWKSTGRLDIPLTIKTISDTQITFDVPADAYLGQVAVSIGYWATVTTSDHFEPLVDFPRTGLVAFYPFSGNPNDLSGNNLNGTAKNYNTAGGPDLASDRFSQSNNSYSFDGNGDYIQVANATPLHINGDMTIAMWVNIPTTVTQDKTIINKHTGTGTDGCNGFELDLVNTSGTSYELMASTKEATAYFVNNYVYSTTGWQLIVFTISGGIVNSYTGYYNTNPQHISPVRYESGNPLIDCDADLLIGGPNNWINVNVHGETFQGMIDDVMIYNRVLTDDEVQKVYVQTVTKY